MFYPADARVPETLRTDEFLLRPLRATDVALDYDAVITSRAELLLRSGGSWPREGFTLEENLADLEQHEQEHLERVAFTYTVMNLTQSECLGCVYLNPPERMFWRAGGSSEQLTGRLSYEAWVTFWVRQSRLADHLDRRLLQALLSWFQAEWAFSRVVFVSQKAQQRQITLYQELGMPLLYTLPHALAYLPPAAMQHASQ